MYIVEEWMPNHPHWSALLAEVEAQGQTEWLDFHAEWHRSSHVIVAHHEGTVIGFLRYVEQEIGPDAGCPPVIFKGVRLLEAKVIAFGVDPGSQGKGVGRALQLKLLRMARAQGCYQVRSHSGGDHPANHHLKLALGFGIHPIIRGEDTKGAYFIMPLQVHAADWES
jgi:GNAT superfamily N-acetyltransferase